MTKEQFIEQIAKYVQKYSVQYGIMCNSAVISQAILESGFGTSELATKANNYFGLKYNPKQPNRCPTACGYYTKIGSEQSKDGTYTSSTMLWQKFKNMEDGVKGYFDFINNSNYSNLKGITDSRKYLETIKADKYCTSLSYVDNCMNVIKTYNLTKYDNKGSDKMTFTNSPLVCYTKLSPNKSKRTHIIDTITIHCMAGNLSVETCGNVFAPTSRQASSNYGIGSDGRIAMYVEEKDRSWCSSNSVNDNRAVTIEVANDGGAPDWHVSDKAMESLIKLCADICKRNGIKELKWKGDKTLIGQVDKQNMTVHRWFAAKACPGNYLYNKHSYIASEVNKLLGVKPSTTPSTPSTTQPTTKTYTVQNGDTLSKIGLKTGIAWKTIADLNGIKSPYVIRKGQVLKLPTNNSNNSSVITAPTPSTPVVSPIKGYVVNGIDYSIVFDPTYYANKYADLKKAFGMDSTKLFEHFLKYGQKEGRQAISTFNVTVYKNRYADLRKAFGNDLPAYYRHYMQFGKKEGRRAV